LEEFSVNKERKIWYLEQYAQQLGTLTISMTQEAARIGGTTGKAIAVFAENSRVLWERAVSYVAALRFDGGKDEDFQGIADVATEITALYANVMEVLQERMADAADISALRQSLRKKSES